MPPATAIAQVRNLVANLRRSLQAAPRGRKVVETSRGGYQLFLADDEVDGARAEDYVSTAWWPRARKITRTLSKASADLLTCGGESHLAT